MLENKFVSDPQTWAGQELATNARVVFTNGCFDLLHPGHIAYLQQARLLGDVLIVGVNDDESVRALKGVRRPMLPLEARMTMLAALESVDAVIPLRGLRNISLLNTLTPDIWVKGGDYTLETLDPEEVAVARRIGIEIEIIPITHEYSTTAIVSTMLSLN